MRVLVTLVVLLGLVELFWRPRFDYTREGWILLWYYTPSSYDRKYVKLFKI